MTGPGAFPQCAIGTAATHEVPPAEKSGAGALRCPPPNRRSHQTTDGRIWVRARAGTEGPGNRRCGKHRGCCRITPPPANHVQPSSSPLPRPVGSLTHREISGRYGPQIRDILTRLGQHLSIADHPDTSDNAAKTAPGAGRLPRLPGSRRVHRHAPRRGLASCRADPGRGGGFLQRYHLASAPRLTGTCGRPTSATATPPRPTSPPTYRDDRHLGAPSTSLHGCRQWMGSILCSRPLPSS